MNRFIRSILHRATFGIVASNKEVERINTPFSYPDNLNEELFRKIAITLAKDYKRLRVGVENQFVYGAVRSVSGISTWYFTIDFNDFGTITGNYWITHNENTDSSIPYSYAKQMQLGLVYFFQKMSKQI